MAKNAHDTPLMQQHRAIKQKYPDAILLFRVGDFYETFGEDAVRAAQVLGITLTRRNNGAAASLELAGFPHHALDNYLHKLVKAGFRVAICDQLEDPKAAKGIVKRGVTEMVTPGLATHDKLLEHKSNNFLAGIHWGDKQLGIALLDISTGEFLVAEGDPDYIDQLIQSLQPAEVVFQKGTQQAFHERFGKSFHTYGLDSWVFDKRYAEERLLKQFGTHSLKGFGIEHLHHALIAAGAVLHYLGDTVHPNSHHITTIHRIDRSEYLWMDQFTIRNLELIQSSFSGGATLLKVMDQTVSPMGARLLKRWILMPLVHKHKIEERLELVNVLIQHHSFIEECSTAIAACGDIERLVSKIPYRKISPREILQIAKGLQQVGQIKLLSSTISNDFLTRLSDTLNACTHLSDRILQEIDPDTPVLLSKGGVIAGGVSEELDHFRELASGGKRFLLEIQQREVIATSISSLKIGFNNVFGYYLEVSNVHKQKVPETWIRKQTLTNAERYITPELKEYEEKIIGAEEKMMRLEAELYEQLVIALQEFILPLQQNSNTLAVIDCLLSFAKTAVKNKYCRPVISEDGSLQLQGARHPVIESLMPPGEQYVSNDLLLNPEDCQIIILTGPNMSGKSALLRQTALITLMAHMGSFVPADEAIVPITDKIFTRVGASDNMSGGESTFMVEMNETASIINNLSSRSLVILDEIGRGTSTYDGISIAWSIAEYLHESFHQPKTLFATHYHEMNELESQFSRIRNYHITHREVDNRIIFLRKLSPGGSTHSFGIHVARMAGMPSVLVDRAAHLLETMEKKQGNVRGQQMNTDETVSNVQLSIFDAHTEVFAEIRKMLNSINIDQLTPLEALVILNEIRKKVK